ncbi:unnamed protein product [Cercopithifilaria johnstoni]|uniref:Uncharacterized protein n=1 Tax=Cercopithifilaria johnstoni TaxID=2874296 RepID=A0A8J2Q6D1_9BILA|nr:unnamed protein product [Cercopithifilaria johnstoni]
MAESFKMNNSSSPKLPLVLSEIHDLANPLSTITYDDDIPWTQTQVLGCSEEEARSNNMVEAVTSFIPVNSSTNQQSKTSTDRCESCGKYHQGAICDPNASFQFRIQKQNMQPRYTRRQKLDELQHYDLNKSKFGRDIMENGNEVFES